MTNDMKVCINFFENNFEKCISQTSLLYLSGGNGYWVRNDGKYSLSSMDKEHIINCINYIDKDIERYGSCLKNFFVNNEKYIRKLDAENELKNINLQLDNEAFLELKKITDSKLNLKKKELEEYIKNCKR